MEIIMQEAVYTPPSWMKPYLDGTRVGYAQAKLAYGDYYNMDGSADMEPECEERLPVMRREMVSYASRTGTKQNLAAMREAGWRLLVSPAGVLRTESMPYCLDNGAWSAYQQGRPFDEVAFGRAVDLLGAEADFIVLPDIVCGGMASLDFSLMWRERLAGIPTLTLIAVQNGVEPDDVREFLSPSCGLFLGGSTDWKLKTCNAWGVLARRRNCHFHVGRVNSAKRIKLCSAAGAHSIDGTSATRFSKTLPRLDAALVHADRQDDFFSPQAKPIDETDFDCGWPFPPRR
ncbi:hypothetical protein [Pseudomonas nitroreducens]|uniref:hypothetical protein n=1 Tax=Pseudomonas nitroreducens TaxID=46680 RepID=UPI00351D4AB1